MATDAATGDAATGDAAFLAPAHLRHRRDVAGLPLAQLEPLNAAALARLGSGGRVGDLGARDHLVIYSSSRMFRRFRDVACRLSVLMFEPPTIQPRHYFFLPLFQKRFHAILTYSPMLLRRCANAVACNGHRCWAAASDAPKMRGVSLIASTKRDLVGHRLRLSVAEKAKDALSLYGRAFRPVDSKNEALDPYRYSVAIENSRTTGYFTEKILDCFVTRTVPIYWGDPDIARSFDPAGIVICRTEADVIAAIRGADAAGYDARREAIEENFRRALPYLDPAAMLAAALERRAAA